MTREEIIDVFRTECPEITSRSVSDSLLQKWCLLGDKQVCALTRCVKDAGTFQTAASLSVYDTRYDLPALLTKFYDIDENPGGGVSLDNEPLDKTSPAKLDNEDWSWRKAAAGKPEEWYRYGQYLYFDRPVSSAYAGKEIRVYYVRVSDDFNNDNITPFNQLTYLEPWHDAIVKYLKMRAKAKVGKRQDAAQASAEFNDYIQLMRNALRSDTHTPIQFAPSSAYRPSRGRR